MLLAVIGNPVAHSLSPRIHAAFARQFGLAVDYRKQLATDLRSAADALRREGARGCNVTLPFKPDAFTYCDSTSERARLARAVNTLIFEDADCRGDNTDGIGLARDLAQNLAVEIAGRRLLLLGAGGAARGVIAPLLAAHPACVHIANRTAGKARELAGHFAGLGPVSGGGLDSLPATAFDLIINATAASLERSLPPLPPAILAADATAYDLVYAAQATPFMRWAAEAGAAHCSDGLGMLVEQAAESFFLWTGKRAHTAPVLEQLRAR